VSLRRIRVVVRRHVYVLWRSPHRWFDIAFWPLMDIVLWGSLGVYVGRQGGDGAAAPYLLAGILMFHVLYQVQIAVSTGFMEETWSRNLLNVMTTPVTEVEYVTGVAAFGLVKLVAAVGTLSLAAFAFFGFSLGDIGWALVPIAAILVVFGWAIAMLTIGLMLRFGQSAEILAWGINFVVLSISGVFNPVDAVPGPLQPLSRILPSTKAFTSLRAVLDGEPVPTSQLAIGFAGAIVALIMGAGFAVWMLRVFRRRGLVTRFS
jgi:ABC-2 type transport system permease protein